MSVTKLELPIALKHFGVNEITNMNRGSYYGANKAKKAVQAEIITYAKKQGVKKIKTPCQVSVCWYITNFRRDLDNLTLKPILDALQQMGALENDNMKHIKRITHDVVKDEKEKIIVEFSELDAERFYEHVQNVIKNQHEIVKFINKVQKL